MFKNDQDQLSDNLNSGTHSSLCLASHNVLQHAPKLFGLPSTVVLIGFGIGGVIFFFLSKVMAIIFAITYFRYMVTIHQQDPNAFEIWLYTLRNPYCGWDASKINKVTVTWQGDSR